MNAHETCLKISSPAEKRTWLEEAQLAKEHDMAKKRRTELDKDAGASIHLDALRKQQGCVEKGRAVEVDRTNSRDFSDPALQASPAFSSTAAKRAHRPVSVFDSTPIVGESTHRTQLHSAIHHPRCGLKGWVHYWAFGSIRR